MKKLIIFIANKKLSSSLVQITQHSLHLNPWATVIQYIVEINSDNLDNLQECLSIAKEYWDNLISKEADPDSSELKESISEILSYISKKEKELEHKSPDTLILELIEAMNPDHIDCQVKVLEWYSEPLGKEVYDVETSNSTESVLDSAAKLLTGYNLLSSELKNNFYINSTDTIKVIIDQKRFEGEIAFYSSRREYLC